MNVLFIFSRHAQKPDDSTLTKDIADEFASHGINVFVMTMLEKRYNSDTTFSVENGYNVLRVKSGNYFDCKRKLEKVFTILTLPHKFVGAAKHYLNKVKIDLIIAHTPFMSDKRIIVPLKRYFKCPAHLILWDLFPQNAKDLGIIKNRLIFNYFKHSEIKMLLAYDQIWAMSDGNVKYLRKHYPQLDKTPIDRLYNSAKIKPLPNLPPLNKTNLRNKYSYTPEDIIALFGGNLGIPQALDNLLELASMATHLLHAKFIIIGKGTEMGRLNQLIHDMNLSNVNMLPQVTRDEYEELAAIVDIGLVSLDPRFTIPNFPSKTTDYFKLGLPILASLDKCAANDYGEFICHQVNAGRFALAGDKQQLFAEYLELYNSPQLRRELGANGRKFYETELNVNKAYNTIMSKFKR